MIRIGAVIACHNRRDATLACLECLRVQSLPSGATISVFVTDDASTDGTAEAIRRLYPQTHLLAGNGRLFWNGGMRKAFEAALSRDLDYYLWLNDDTHLYPDAIHVLLGTCRAVGDEAIIVGSTLDPGTGQLTYGGVVRESRLCPLRFRLVQPGATPCPCDTMNGNCVLIPRTVAIRIGNLSSGYVQSMGDFDYALRAGRAGFTVLVAPRFAGTCRRNPVQGTWKDSSLPLRVRIGKLLGVKGLPPRQWLRFASRYAGVLWPIYWLSPYIRLLLGHLMLRQARHGRS